MTPPTSDKLQKLLKMHALEPLDAFLLYGIAMEYKKLDALPLAIEYFDRVLTVDPGYCYAFYQRAQTQEMLGDVASAKSSYLAGISAAERVGDGHARGELQAALEMLEA